MIIIGQIFGMVGCIIGYMIGLKIWDKFILPVLEERKNLKQRKIFLKYIELCKIIGNPENKNIL